MVRLWTRPDGRMVEQVFVSEDEFTVAHATVRLAEKLPGATYEDYSNDAYQALLAMHGENIGRWRSQDGIITALPVELSAHDTAKQELAAATTIAQMKIALGKLL